MNREELLYKSELEANKSIVKMCIPLAILFGVVAMLVPFFDIELAKGPIILLCLGMAIVFCIPIFFVFVLKKNGKGTKKIIMSFLFLLAAVSFVGVESHALFALIFMLLVSGIYNDKKLSMIALSIDIVVIIMAYAVKPLVLGYKNFNIASAILLESMPAIIMIILVFFTVKVLISRNIKTIDYMVDNNENLRISSEGFQKILVASQRMLHTVNYEKFASRSIQTVEDIVGFLRNSVDHVTVRAVYREADGKYRNADKKKKLEEKIIIDEKYIKFLGINDDNDNGISNDISIPYRANGEGECIINNDNIVMTFYERNLLQGAIVVGTSINRNHAESKAIIDMLYNSIKLCMVSKKSEDMLIKTQEELICSFSEISESKSHQTGGHIKRVSEYMKIIGKSICKSKAEQNALACAAMLHDVGKIIIPDEILEKPGKLTTEEYSVIKKHTAYGADLLKDVQGDMMKMAYDIALEHHERWDGKGYMGLKGEDINYYARYVAVIDVFDALISKRSYKEAWPIEKAYDEIVNNSGTQFAPEAVEVFKERFEELKKVHEKYPDEE